MGWGARGDRDAQALRDSRWEQRRGLSRLLKVSVFVGPVGAAFGVAVVLGHLLPRAASLAANLFSVAVIGVGSLATLLATERFTRRLLPLAALLDLSLTFPDRAPGRFAVARRSGRPADLRASLERASQSGRIDQAQHLQKVIELVLALSVHDRASRGHSERVRVFTDLLADELRIPDRSRHRLRWAALLHDIGKLEVSPAILNKPAPPSEEEWAVLHRHPDEGARLIAPLLPWLGEWGLAVAQHHERFDGTGYPRRLRANQISLSARIVSVADVYEVMTAPRPYKQPMSVTAARAELVRVAGAQLDPAIVRAFLNISVGRLWRTIGFGAWMGQIPALARFLDAWGSRASGMGIATAVAATVLAVGGGVSPVPSSTALVAHGAAVGLAPADGGGATARPPSPGTSAGEGARPAGPGGRTSAPATGSKGSSPPTGVVPPLPGAAGPRTPGSGPTAHAVTPTGAASTPRSASTPTPIPPPATCSACTNTAAFCAIYCNNNNAVLCLRWCQGNNNTVCTAHCWGARNLLCTSYCTGGRPACMSVCVAAYVWRFPAAYEVRQVIIAGGGSSSIAEWRLAA